MESHSRRCGSSGPIPPDACTLFLVVLLCLSGHMETQLYLTHDVSLRLLGTSELHDRPHDICSGRLGGALGGHVLHGIMP